MSKQIAYGIAGDGGTSMSGNGCGYSEELSPTLNLVDKHSVSCGAQIRRLTPVECERLQGFPDNYTLMEGASDAARYKALGNSMAVPVMRWIGRRIQEVSDMTRGPHMRASLMKGES